MAIRHGAARRSRYESHGAISTASFDPVSLEMLIDSPVLAGKYFKEIPLAPEITPKHYPRYGSRRARGPRPVACRVIENFSRLVREAGALYQSHHYGEYHFLVTLSDSVAHFGLEHHQSSDDRIPLRTFIDRRPVHARPAACCRTSSPIAGTASTAAPRASPPATTSSRWKATCSGSTKALLSTLAMCCAVRSGIWTPEQFRGHAGGQGCETR